MALKSMEMNDQARKDYMGCCPSTSDQAEGPKYPYGLELRLDTEGIKKLGLEGCNVGDTCAVVAKGKVTAKSSNDREGGEPTLSLEIQLTDMDVSTQGEQEVSTQDYLQGLMSKKE